MEAPDRYGVGRRDLFRFVPISPFSCSDLRSLFSGIPDLFRFVPTCSDFFRSIFRTNHRKQTNQTKGAGRASGPQSVFPQNLQILSVRFPYTSLAKIWLPKTPFWRGLSGTNSGGRFAPGRFCLLPKRYCAIGGRGGGVILNCAAKIRS